MSQSPKRMRSSLSLRSGKESHRNGSNGSPQSTSPLRRKSRLSPRNKDESRRATRSGDVNKVECATVKLEPPEEPPSTPKSPSRQPAKSQQSPVAAVSRRRHQYKQNRPQRSKRINSPKFSPVVRRQNGPTARIGSSPPRPMSLLGLRTNRSPARYRQNAVVLPKSPRSLCPSPQISKKSSPMVMAKSPAKAGIAGPKVGTPYSPGKPPKSVPPSPSKVVTPCKQDYPNTEDFLTYLLLKDSGRKLPAPLKMFDRLISENLKKATKKPPQKSPAKINASLVESKTSSLSVAQRIIQRSKDTLRAKDHSQSPSAVVTNGLGASVARKSPSRSPMRNLFDNFRRKRRRRSSGSTSSPSKSPRFADTVGSSFVTRSPRFARALKVAGPSVQWTPTKNDDEAPIGSAEIGSPNRSSRDPGGSKAIGSPTRSREKEAGPSTSSSKRIGGKARRRLDAAALMEDSVPLSRLASGLTSSAVKRRRPCAKPSGPKVASAGRPLGLRASALAPSESVRKSLARKKSGTATTHKLSQISASAAASILRYVVPTLDSCSSALSRPPLRAPFLVEVVSVSSPLSLNTPISLLYHSVEYNDEPSLYIGCVYDYLCEQKLPTEFQIEGKSFDLSYIQFAVGLVKQECKEGVTLTPSKAGRRFWSAVCQELGFTRGSQAWQELESAYNNSFKLYETSLQADIRHQKLTQARWDAVLRGRYWKEEEANTIEALMRLSEQVAVSCGLDESRANFPANAEELFWTHVTSGEPLRTMCTTLPLSQSPYLQNCDVRGDVIGCAECAVSPLNEQDHSCPKPTDFLLDYPLKNGELVLETALNCSGWSRNMVGFYYVSLLVHGSHKIWYMIDSGQADKLGKKLQQPTQSNMISVTHLDSWGVEWTRLVQSLGEVVLVPPGWLCLSLAPSFAASHQAYITTQHWWKEYPKIMAKDRLGNPILDLMQHSWIPYTTILWDAVVCPTDRQPHSLLKKLCLQFINQECSYRACLKTIRVGQVDVTPHRQASPKRCERCSADLYFSVVRALDTTVDVSGYCLRHGLELCKTQSPASLSLSVVVSQAELDRVKHFLQE